MYYKCGGEWKEIKSAHVKKSGEWKTVTAGYFKTDGEWKQFYVLGIEIPDNMLILGRTTLSDFTLCDGNNSTDDLLNMMPRCTTGNLSSSFLWADTHSHSTLSVNTGLAGVGTDWMSGNAANQGHNHTMNHSHGSVNHLPPYRSVIPYVGEGMITEDMLFFYDNNTLHSSLTRDSNYLGRFIRFMSSITTGGNTNHSHSISGNTGSRSVSQGHGGSSWTMHRYMGNSHRHSYNHTHTSTNIPPFINLDPVYIKEGTAEFPSGLCAFFLGNPPSDWSTYSSAQDRFIKCESSEATSTGGATSHSHTYSGSSGTGGRATHATWGGEPCGTSSHTHTINHTHGSTTSMPRAKNIKFCKKD